jgi:methionyl-tRNA synthetase
MAEACRLLGHLMAPFMPDASRAQLTQLGAPPEYDAVGAGGPGLEALLVWGAGPTPWLVGTPSPLFPRLEVGEPAEAAAR